VTCANDRHALRLQYLDVPLSAAQIDGLLQQLGFDDPRALMHRSETRIRRPGLIGYDGDTAKQRWGIWQNST